MVAVTPAYQPQFINYNVIDMTMPNVKPISFEYKHTIYLVGEVNKEVLKACLDQFTEPTLEDRMDLN